MAAEALFRLLGQVTGSGKDKVLPIRALLSDVPTQAGGPVEQSLTTTAAAFDVSTVVSGELVALMVHALVSNAYVDPTGVSTLVSDYCYIPEGQVNLYTFETAVSCLPVVRGKAAGVGKVEYMWAAVS
jgi:hypothetical protein